MYFFQSLDPLSSLEGEFPKSTTIPATIDEDISIYFNISRYGWFCYLVMGGIELGVLATFMST